MIAGRKRVVVCADDFGLTTASCAAAVQLVDRGLVSAVSAVVDGDIVEAFAPALRRVARGHVIGLHLNLTERSACPHVASLETWILRGVSARKWRGRLTREILRQLERFEALFGAPPAFIDGHEHVHQLRAIRDPLLEVIARRFGTHVPVRSTSPMCYRGVKACVIAGLGAAPLAKVARASHIAMNHDFAGVYDFSARVPFESRLRGWLASIADGGLLMCHPEDSFSQARVRKARADEFEFLSSPRWRELQQELGIELVPFTAAI